MGKFGKSLIPIFFAAVCAASVITLGPLSAIALGTAAGDTTAAAGEEQGGPKISIERWLALGPLPWPYPAFHDEGTPAIDAAYLLSFDEIATDELRPTEDGTQALPGGAAAAWKTVLADSGGIRLPADSTLPQIAYLAAYVEVRRWTKMDIEASTTDPLEISIDGTSILTCKMGSGAGDPGSTKSATAKLERGKHLLLVKTVHVPGDSVTQWRLNVTAGAVGDARHAPSFSLSPTRSIAISDVLAIPNLAVAISPDGSLIALTKQTLIPPGGETVVCVEIRRFSDGSLVRTLRDIPALSGIQWAPIGMRLSYVTREKDKGTIRYIDLDTGAVETIADGVEKLGTYAWSPDGTYIVYSVSEEPKKDETGIKRLVGIYDRTNYGRAVSCLYAASATGGAVRRLSAGKHDTGIEDIHSGSKKMLISRRYEDLSERPYGVTELYLTELDGRHEELLYRGRWLRSARWSPDGRSILVLAGPSTFGTVGLNLPEGMIPNDYDTQAYILDPETKDVDAITRDFAPTVVWARWSRSDGNIYLCVEEKSLQRLYRFNPKKKRYMEIDLGFDYLDEGDIALDRPLAALIGMSADQPPRLYTLDLRRDNARLIHDPLADEYRYIEIGEVEDWHFTSSEGKLIEGHIHYPGDFDPGEKYPCIVYYYGGTFPTAKSFGGRYPKNLWAAMGYIVYVLQPSGATGFGQEFSAYHVNDWGRIVADEIIEGVSQFLEAHPFVDPSRVGCIGASYGGFMTQLVITRTDIFSAAVSHAGISSITSYWGEGYWGYAYNSVAAAGSFPWNRPDIYVGQSPLFHADRINTPLLLLHGTSDTNVPAGESEQMYTALKLLGKQVEYVRFAEQNHFILDYKKRIAWSNTIVAWFDRWLKNEPEWWNDLYPPIGEEETGGPKELTPGQTGGAAESPDEVGEKTEVPPGELGAHVIEKPDGQVVLVGRITRRDIDTHLPGWSDEYFDYATDGATVSALYDYIHDVDIVCVLGTWCGDSRREVPRLWKILEETGYGLSKLAMLAVERSKVVPDESTPAELIDWSNNVRRYYDVKAVESIIVYRGRSEIGRIVEAPAESLEKDLLAILSR